MIGSTIMIRNYMDELFENPKCELNYNKDYELLLATMLSAQTTDKRVNMVTSKLFKKYPTIYDLSTSNINDIIDIIKPIGTFNKKAKNVILISQRLVNDYGGKVPNNREYLESLPGVGRKTTNVVLSNLFNEPCIAVDTHVARVSVRLGLVEFDDSSLIIEEKLTKLFDKAVLSRIHQQFVLFGRYYCTARCPKCNGCKLQGICKFYGN